MRPDKIDRTDGRKPKGVHKENRGDVKNFSLV